MKLNKDYVMKLMKDRNWNQADLARAMEVDSSTVSRIFKGNRGTGKEVISGFIKAFPGERIDKLFFLNTVSPNGNKTKAG